MAGSEVLKRQSEYWLRTLAGAPTVLKLPTDRPRPAQQDYSGSCVEFVLHDTLTTQLKELSQRHGTTLFVALLTGWALVLARLSHQDDLVIGTPSANRTRSEIEGLIGLFSNTLALRIDLSDDPTLATLLERVSAVVLGAQANQDLPFEHVEELIPPPMAHTPIFQVILAWQNNGAELPGLELDDVGVDDRAQHDLALDLADVGATIRGRLIYATSLFERSTIERFARYLQETLNQMVADPTQGGLSDPVLLAAERHRLLVEAKPIEAAYPQNRRIQELIEAKEARDPEAIAYGCELQGLRYRELNAPQRRRGFAFARLNYRPRTRVLNSELRL
ncbi:hypothetical protein AJ88_37645 [Mesorhizobium amorphae CCBAU 01583]|nr:hypothetical protein AJ88_37645 [Mesorhizobium amorphae CCBAU 01583]